MGSTEKEEDPNNFEPDPLANFAHVNIDSPISEKELKATCMVMDENRKNKMHFMEKVLTPHDNADIPYEYELKTLPVDKDGYCVSFTYDEPEQYVPFFEEFGVIVIRDVLTNEECVRSEDEVWDFVSRLSDGKIERDNPETWKRWISLKKLGILGNDCILSKQICENRQNEKIYEVYRHLLGCDELMVNVGRASLMRPTKDVSFDIGLKDMPEWKTMADWLHWDMNMWTGWTTTFSWQAVDHDKNKGYDKVKVQGWVSLVDCAPEDGGFHCVPGFAPHMRGWANENSDKFSETTTLSTFQVPKDDPIRSHIQKVAVKAGSLVIWSSKTPHGTFPNNSNHGRMIQYIKMADANDPSITTLFDDPNLLPRDFELTELGQKLHGFKKW